MHAFDLLAALQLAAFELFWPVALAATAALGYLAGHFTKVPGGDGTTHLSRDLRRAQRMAQKLEKTAWGICRNLARRRTVTTKLTGQSGRPASRQQEPDAEALQREADAMLASTLRAAIEIGNTYEQVCRQANKPAESADAGTDPLTGVGSRRRLDDALTSQFAMVTRYGQGFSVALFDLDHFAQFNQERGPDQGDKVLKQVARILEESARETDVVVRSGGEAFAVVLPQTDLEEASVFADRWRRTVREQLPVTVSGGVAAALDGDSAELLMERVRSALLGAKSAGRDCVFRHNGLETESIFEEQPA